MSEFYFTKFPLITYANTSCRDISRRVVLSPETRNKPTIFYPYEVRAGMRADVLADAYYEDSYYDWLIYLTNRVVDPYYGWYLSETEFDDFLKSKYGSIEITQKKIKYYQLDLGTDDIDISVDFYTNTLPEALKKYYVANYGYSSKVISYRRRQEDWTTNTNRIVSLKVDDSGFGEGEIVDFLVNQYPVGQAEVVTSNSSVLVIQNVSGNTSANTTVTGQSTGASALVTESSILQLNIPIEEHVYWTPVTVYEWERERNEEKKIVMLLDANYAMDTAEQLRKKLKE